MKLRESPFLHVVPVSDDHHALYHSLSMEVAFLAKDFVEHHRENGSFFSSDETSEGILTSLKNIGLLLEDGSDGYEIYRDYREALDEPAINILYLLLTDACNIGCKYCYFLAPMPDDYHPSLMSRETAIAALNFFARCVQRSIAKGHPDQHVVLYGGEPTLNKEVLLDALRYIRHLRNTKELPETLSVTLNTNGTLLDEDILLECKATNAVVAISIDGPKEIHDQMRVSRSGRGTFDKVVASYRRSKDLGVRTGICVTIDRHNLSHMEEVVRWLALELGATGLGFNILIEHGSGDDLSLVPVEQLQYPQIVAQGLINTFKVARELGVYEDRMMRRVNNFLDKTPVMSDCGGCGLQAVISPDGQIGVCQAFCGEKKFFVEKPFGTFRPEEHPYWKQWRHRSPLANDACKDCIALGNCGGGCPYNAYRAKGDIDALDERFCAHAISATHFLIRDLWEKTSVDQ